MKGNLYYEIVNEEYIFYYGKEILFKNSKNSPFLLVYIEKEGVKKVLPLHFCDIVNTGNIGYKINFYNTSCMVVFNIIYRENKIIFNFTRKGLLGEKLKIRLNRLPGNIRGLGLNNKKNLIKSSYSSKGGLFNKANDNLLAFSIKDWFFFKNNGIEDWEINFNNKIELETRQSDGGFILEFNKNFEISDKKEAYLYNILDTEEIEKYKNFKSPDGFISPYKNNENLAKNISTLRKNNCQYYMRISPVIDLNEIIEKKYDDSGLFYIGENQFLVDKNNIQNMRIFSNKIRDYLDLNIDGFYIDERDIKVTNSIILESSIIYKNLTDLIERISLEYPNKNHIYNKFSSSAHYNSVYSIRYKDIKGQEDIFINSLKFSGIDSVFYECSEREAVKLKRRGKKQLIIYK